MAIAFDSATNPSYVTNTHTFDHTCTGSNILLWVQTWRRGGAANSGVTYDSVAMTPLTGGEKEASDAGGGSEYLQLWYLAIASGAGVAKSVVVSSTGGASTEHIDSAVSYSGCSQTAIPDSSSFLVKTTQSNTTATTTTAADNSWAILFIRCGSTGTSTAGSGTTRRANVDGFHQVYDGAGVKTPPGNYSLNTTHTSQQTGFWMASFAPYTASATNSGFLQFM